ncbi:MAG: hypothetical protein ACJAR1_000297 [Rubritalea sp.]|jgi:hypothetical protein
MLGLESTDKGNGRRLFRMRIFRHYGGGIDDTGTFFRYLTCTSGKNY